MSVMAERARTTGRWTVLPPPLENGDRLGPAEFLRRYEGNPDLKKAELIEGVVCMPSPVSADHARPDNLTLHVPSLLALDRAKVLGHLQRGPSSTAHRVFVRSLR